MCSTVEVRWWEREEEIRERESGNTKTGQLRSPSVWTRQGKEHSKNNKAQPTAIKTVWFGNEHRYIDQWSKTERLDIQTYINVPLIFDKGVTTFQEGENNLLNRQTPIYKQSCTLPYTI